MACKNGIMIILPNLQDKASCNYEVLDIHTDTCKYAMYYKMEFGIKGQQKEIGIEGNYKNYKKLQSVQKTNSTAIAMVQ